jgi:NYN domain
VAEPESSALCVLVDYENMARPGVKGRGDFDIHLVLNRLADKGRVLVKRAYADWSRYRDARHDLQNAGLELIEMPSAREGAKNRADIKMAVDAMEFAFSRDHLTDFVIVSGDSDFTPLVGKLRELNKRVTGMGNRDSASELLIANCDEFIFYDNLAARAATASTVGGRTVDPVDMLRATLTALQREGVEWPLASVVKDSMRRKNPAFDENEVGFSTFSKFLDTASKKGIVRLETDPRSGTYRVELAEGGTTSAPPSGSSATAERPAAPASGEEPGEGRGRRRRRPRRGESSAPAGENAPAAPSGADVFEFVVEPTVELDMSALPPLDQPISYEDMIMLGPELGEDVPELVEVSDAVVEEAPTPRRRRRRRGTGDSDADEGTAAEPVVEVPASEPTDEDAAPTSRRRRRRSVTPTDDTPVDEAPAVAIVPEPEVAPTPAPAAEPVADEGAPTRGRVRRGSRVAELLGDAEPAAVVEEAPAPKPRARRTTRKAAEPSEAASGEEPVASKPRARRATKKADPKVADTVAGDEPAAPKRRIRRSAAPPVPEAAEATTAEEPTAPKRRVRRTTKAAEPAAE